MCMYSKELARNKPWWKLYSINIVEMAANNAGTNTVTVLEYFPVLPSLDHSIAEKLLPLTFFDIFWLNWPSLSRVYFYDFPCSAAEFAHTVVPRLKKSLALTLKYYYPFCGKLIAPTTLSSNTTPVIRYLNGDSVLLTIAEFGSNSSEGFKHLSGNHARDVDDLLGLVPELYRGGTDTGGDDGFMISPVLSVQVTLFPDHGISVGFRNSHAVADGKTMYDFVRTWAFINAEALKSEDDYDDLINLPFYERNVIKDPKGIASIFLRGSLRMAQQDNSKAVVAIRKNLVQSTLVMNRVHIQGLKNLVSAKFQHVSTFGVACAYVWTSMAKARAALGQEMNEDNEMEERFVYAVDTRSRLDPPLPSNYFGNAVVFCRAILKTKKLVGEEGFVNAFEEIRRVLYEKIKNEKGILEGFEMLFDQIESTKGQRGFGVAGSPKFDYYSTNYGWGKPKKYEVVSEKFGLIGSRDSEGGLEIGVCFTTEEMDTFTKFFNQGLINLQSATNA